MARNRVLTGITTTGTPHLGNYVGAIRPAIESSKQGNVDAYLFLADYHALIKSQDPLILWLSRAAKLPLLGLPWGSTPITRTFIASQTYQR